MYIMAGLGKKDKKREMFGQLDGGAIIFQFGS